jgi:hypothetical protein
MKFIGCDIRIVAGKGTVVVAHNKNMGPMLKTGRIRYQRFPHWKSELRTVVKLRNAGGTDHLYGTDYISEWICRTTGATMGTNPRVPPERVSVAGDL